MILIRSRLYFKKASGVKMFKCCTQGRIRMKRWCEVFFGLMMSTTMGGLASGENREMCCFGNYGSKMWRFF